MQSDKKSGGVTAGGMLDKQHMTNAAVAIGAGFVSIAAVSESGDKIHCWLPMPGTNLKANKLFA